MPRARRWIKSNTLYHIVFRARSGLPFCCTMYMRLILEGILARVQRDDKVIVNHHLFEGSHVHLIVTAKDSDACKMFYGQIEKQITDSIKRLLGLEHLSLWTKVTAYEIPTLIDAINEIVYLYTNPSNDDLTAKIEDYPGVSSWDKATRATSLNDCMSSWHPWIQLPMIESLPCRSVTDRQDRLITERMRSKAIEKHELKIYPNQWIGLFIKNPTAENVNSINKRIVSLIRRKEAANAIRRQKAGKQVLGAKRLKAQILLKPHTPKKKGRKIFVKSIFREIRIKLISDMKHISALCKHAYERWKIGDYKAVWPPGTFLPPLPPRANALVAY